MSGLYEKETVGDGLDSSEFAKIVHTVEPRAHAQGSRVVVRGAEVSELFSHLGLYAAGLFVVEGFAGSEEPVHAVGNTGREIQVFEEGEGRQADAERMLHTVVQLVDKTEVLLVKVGQFEVDAVLQGGIVRERDLFVDAFLPDTVFLLERIEPTHGEGYIREGDGVRTVAGVLVVEGVDGEVELAVPVA